MKCLTITCDVRKFSTANIIRNHYHWLQLTYYNLADGNVIAFYLMFNKSFQVDMPVFFYIDPEFTEDPAMVKVDTITLSYTFFEAKEAEKLGI